MLHAGLVTDVKRYDRSVRQNP